MRPAHPPSSDDGSWWAALIVIALIVAALMLFTRHPHAESSAVTIRGRILATDDDADEGHFTIEPEGESDTVSLSVTGYLIDWFKGGTGHRVKLTIEPE